VATVLVLAILTGLALIARRLRFALEDAWRRLTRDSRAPPP